MSYWGPASPTERLFRKIRREWLEARVQDLAKALEIDGAQLSRLLPADFGDQHRLAAATVARVAADRARARSVAETVHWLERLLPGAHPHDLTDAVRELRSRLAPGDEPALWSWNAEVWEQMLLWWWRRNQAGTGDMDRDFAEWGSRWSAEVPGNGPVDTPERAPRHHGRELLTLAEFFAHEPEPVGLLARAVLDAPETAATVQDAVLLREEHLQAAGHLVWLAKQEACAEALEAWRRAHQAGGSDATRAFLAELSEAVKRYTTGVLHPVTGALSACERALLSDSRHGPRRSAADYLDAFLDFLDWQGEAPDDAEVVEAADLVEQGRPTWHGMDGSLPVWSHIVTSPQERAAAKAYSGEPSTSVLRVRTGAEPVQESSDLFADAGGGASPAQEPEWYPEPGIDVRYAADNAFDLCALLAVARLGYARLQFFTVGADGGLQRLRTVLARVREEDALAWRRWALASLAELAPDPDDLADALARQDGDSDGDGDDRLDDDGPEAGRTSEEPVVSPAAGGLPAALLGKVRALLRQAENSGVTEEEARVFLDKATELMAKYGIEQAMLDDVSEPGRPVDKVVDVHPPYVKEARRLLSWIAHEMRCHAIYPGGKDNRHRVHLFGFDADLHATEVLFTSLRFQMLSGADTADALHRPEGEDVRAYKRSWMLGFMREVTARIGAAQRAARAAADEQQADPLPADSGGRSVALVLADRSAVVEAQVSARYPKLAKARPTKFKGTGYWQGVADGKHAEIGGPAFAEQEENAQLTH
ncbi:DUF2786 domain-containing protein [Streptomyces sp. A0642]|uniref:DUF2786 domain-containing protein n=1 Tax=Streptomyces sp. A0642 TaxID=2563100 RepID=UPI0010A28CC0|nr:DUF2786 domain-containing protein [Streptomyces sp. A0642]THA77100.1 DUF2786 domain-containing protein [Streptomyces sp. A0642]